MRPGPINVKTSKSEVILIQTVAKDEATESLQGRIPICWLSGGEITEGQHVVLLAKKQTPLLGHQFCRGWANFCRHGLENCQAVCKYFYSALVDYAGIY